MFFSFQHKVFACSMLLGALVTLGGPTPGQRDVYSAGFSRRASWRYGKNRCKTTFLRRGSFFFWEREKKRKGGAGEGRGCHLDVPYWWGPAPRSRC